MPTKTKVSKKVDSFFELSLALINGYAHANGKNIRDPFDKLGAEEVLFRSELEEGDTITKVLWEMVFSDDATAESHQQYIDLIEKNERRIAELATSIADDQQLQPIQVVPQYDDHGEIESYKLFGGARRYMACILAWLKDKLPSGTVLARVHQMTKEQQTDMDVKAVADNRFGKKMNPVEIGRICIQLKQQGLTFEQIAVKLGLYSDGKEENQDKPSKQLVRNYICLHSPDIPDEERMAIAMGKKKYTTVLRTYGKIKEGKNWEDSPLNPKNKKQQPAPDKYVRHVAMSYKALKADWLDNSTALLKKLKEAKLPQTPEMMEAVRVGLHIAMNLPKFHKYEPQDGEDTPPTPPKKKAPKKTTVTA